MQLAENFGPVDVQALDHSGKGFDMPAFAALRESTPSRQAQGELTLVPQLRDYSISMAVAMETPPPPHRVARPSVFLRFFIAWMSVTMIRLPVAPTG